MSGTCLWAAAWKTSCGRYCRRARSRAVVADVDHLGRDGQPGVVALQLEPEEVEPVLVDVREHELAAPNCASCRQISLPIEPAAPVTSTRRPTTQRLDLLRVEVAPARARAGPRERASAAWPPGVVVEVRERDRKHLVLELELARSGRGSRGSRRRRPRDREEQLLDAFARTIAGHLLEASQHGAPADGGPDLARIVVDEPHDLVLVLVGAPQVAQQQVAGAPGADDHGADPPSGMGDALLVEPGHGEARREADRPREPGREQELDHHDRAGRSEVDVLRLLLQEVEQADEARGAGEVCEHETAGLGQPREPERPVIEAEGVVQGQPDRDEPRQEAPELREVRRGHVALETQRERDRERQRDERGVDRDQQGVAAPARHGVQPLRQRAQPLEPA